MSTLRGIDISSYQNVPDFAAVKAAGYTFVVIKATEGVSYVNPLFAAQFAGAKAASMQVLTYHFAQPDRNAAADEAAFHAATVAGVLQPGDGDALDLETGTGNLAAWALSYLQTAEASLGFKPLLYTGPSFIIEHSLNTPDIATFGIWLADWVAAEPDPPADWGFIAIWQYSATGSVPGISGLVDTDLFMGDADQLARYGKPAPVTPPKPALVWDDESRLALVGYIANGSGPADIGAWVQKFEGASS